MWGILAVIFVTSSSFENNFLNSRLVTTDALARGIDLQNVDYVILYDAPRYVKNYIHRIGRTGRAGKKGTSLVLISPDQVFNLVHNTTKFKFQIVLH